MQVISTTPTKISLCSLWRDKMISGFNHLKVSVREYEDSFAVQSIPELDIFSMFKNRKPVMLNIDFYDPVTDSKNELTTVLSYTRRGPNEAFMAKNVPYIDATLTIILSINEEKMVPSIAIYSE